MAKIVKKFKVRDLRHKEKLMIDDLYLNGYAKYCGHEATLVYLSLCRHANFYTQQAFPSKKKIEEELAISRRKVNRGIKQLKEWNIISVNQVKDKKGRFSHNLYTLLDKSEWKNKPCYQKRDTGNKTKKDEPYPQKPTHGKRPPKVNKSMKVNKISPKGDKRTYGNDNINEIISLLKDNLEVEVLDGSQKQNRQYAWLLLKKVKHNMRSIKFLIEFIGKDDYWSSKIASARDLYYNIVKIGLDAKRKLKPKKKIII